MEFESDRLGEAKAAVTVLSGAVPLELDRARSVVSDLFDSLGVLGWRGTFLDWGSLGLRNSFGCGLGLLTFDLDELPLFKGGSFNLLQLKVFVLWRHPVILDLQVVSSFVL